MTATREVYIRITALDGTVKTIDAIESRLKNLSRLLPSISNNTNVEQHGNAVINSITQNAEKKVVAEKRAATEIERIQQQTRRQAEQQDKLREKAAKTLADVQTREAKRGADDFIREIKRMRGEADAAAKGIQKSFAATFAGSFLGTLVGGFVSQITGAIGRIPSELGKALDAGKSFERLNSSLNVLNGNAEVTRTKLAELRELAKTTAGLDFRGAAEGQRNLQAVGFAADQATQFMQGLAKVRILSGGTKEDFKAVLYNLSQIRANGKLTGDELRESVMRLPYLARVVQQEFGTLNSKTINELVKNSDEFFKRLNKGLSEVPVVAGGATLAFEQLSEASDRFYTATGNIILQNPEFLSLVQVLTRGLDDQAAAFENLESRQARAFASIVSGFAKAGLEAAIFVKELKAAFVEIGRVVGFVGLTVYNGIQHLFSSVGGLMNFTILEPLNRIIVGANQLVDQIKTIPSAVFGTTPVGQAFAAGVQAIPQFSPIQLLPDNRGQIEQRQADTVKLFLRDLGTEFGRTKA